MILHARHCILLFTINIYACQDYGDCPEGFRNCGEGTCVKCCNDDDCASEEICIDGKCEINQCFNHLGVALCTTHYCPATGTFECSPMLSGYPDFCTCPVEGGCDYISFIENCAYPPDCACVNWDGNRKCVREPDCPYGVVCSRDQPPYCECAQEPVECVDANRTCEEIANDMLEFHAANSLCTDEYDCKTIKDYVNLVENVCCSSPISMNANVGIWYALEEQLMCHTPQCSEYIIENCCMAPAPHPICIEGHCGW